MVDQFNVSYLYKKRGMYYFSKRISSDVRSYYKSDRIVICLRTKSNVSAICASKSLYQRLDEDKKPINNSDGTIEVDDIINADNEYSEWRDRDRMWMSGK